MNKCQQPVLNLFLKCATRQYYIYYLRQCIGGHQLTVLFIYLLLNNYHRFFTISLTPTQQITNTVFNMNFIVYTQTQDTTQ